MTSLRFFISDDPIAVESLASALVKAIPDNWAWLDGQLRAPKLRKLGFCVARGVGFMVGRHSGIAIAMDRVIDDNPSDCIELILGKSAPSSVTFMEAGFEGSHPSLAMSKLIANEFIRRQYSALLYCYSVECSNVRRETPLWRARIHLDTEQLYVDIVTKTEDAAVQEDVRSLLEVCASFNLSSEPIHRSDLVG